jgi:CheY-like chemotaxis protein
MSAEVTTPPAFTTTAAAQQLGNRVMLVDDESALLTVGKAILSTLGIEVLTASSGEEALAQLQEAIVQQTLPSVILLDLTMPGGMSGLDAMDHIAKILPEIPVIACSGFFGDGAEEVCRRLGFFGMLSKPYTPEALITVVRRTCIRSTE